MKGHNGRIDRAARAARRAYQPDDRSPGLAEADAYDAARQSLIRSKHYEHPKGLRKDIRRAMNRAGI